MPTPQPPLSADPILARTLDPAHLSWVASANDPLTDFPLQNLPYGRFRRSAEAPWRIGVAIGDQVLDLRAAGLIDTDDMNALMAQARTARRALRVSIFDALLAGSPQEAVLRATALLAQQDVELGLPCTVGDYTDFYTSIHHATNIGRQFRPDNPLLPNYRWIPIGYHGRSSSLVPSGTALHRPVGQTKPADEAGALPPFGPCKRLDYELELGLFVGGAPTALGESLTMEAAEERLFGVTLLNDWSARDIQGWEYQPLGPFLSKNFGTTLSPWMVTLEALEPFRAPFVRAEGEPQPLPYLDSATNRARGVMDIRLEVWIETAQMRAKGTGAVRLSESGYADAYWTAAQMLAHHTVNGCNVRPGDLMGTGTLSGPGPGQAAAMVELSQGGKRPIDLGNGETRTFLEDGDTLMLRGYCTRPGVRRIGFGPCSGTVLPVRAQAS